MKTTRPGLFPVLISIAATTAAATAAPGSLHTAFGAGGKVTANYSAFEVSNAVAVQSDGKIIIAGYSAVFGNADVAVLRYNANGTLDTTFSGDGGVLTDVGISSTDVATCVAVQSDGKILVGGYSNASGVNDHLLLRYNTNGTLDTTFGSNGRILYNAGGNDQAAALAIQPDGKIVLVGRNYIGTGEDFTIFRFSKEGMPDPTFSVDGFRTYSFGFDDYATSVAIQEDGKIVVAGYCSSNTNDFAVLRMHPNSDLDNSFHFDGKVTINMGGDDRAMAMKIQSDGKILLGGYTTNVNMDFALARLNTDGAPDFSFGGSGNGRIEHHLGGSEAANGMVLQPDGKAILVGYSNGTGTYDFTLTRYNTNGTPDTTFGVAGKVSTDIAGFATDVATAAALQPDGRLVAAGYAGNDFAVARYNLITVRADARIGPNSNATSGNNIYNTTGASQTLNVTVPKAGGKKTSYLRVQNDGHETGAINVKGTGSNKNFTVRYLSGNSNVTSSVVAGTFSTGNLVSGASSLLKVEVTAKTKAANKNGNVRITATGGGTTDTVIVKAKSK